MSLISFPQNSLELGVQAFGGSFNEETDEGIHTYEETTDLLAITLMANYIFGYTPSQSGLFFITGIGLASINIEWEERSSTDVSLGQLLPGGGSMQSEDGSAGGTVFNFGIGGSFSNGLDVRAELPIIVPFEGPGETTAIPVLIATLGYRF